MPYPLLPVGDAPVIEDWLNHVTIAAPQNGTTSHTMDPSNATGGGTVVGGTAFTPTPGRALAVFSSGGVTFTTPSGWTLPPGGSAVGNSGLYMFFKGTAAGGDTFTTTQNGTNYPVNFDIFEFPAGTTVVDVVASAGVANGAAGPIGAPGVGTHWIAAVASMDFPALSGACTGTWASGTKVTDTMRLRVAGADGYWFGLTEFNSDTSTTKQVAVTVSNPQTTIERLVVSLLVGTGLVVTPAAVDMVASSTLVVGGVREQQAAVALVATSSLTVGGVREQQPAVAMTATSTLSTTAVRQSNATVAMTATSTMAVGAVREPQAAVAMTATSTMTADALRSAVAAVAMTGVSTLSVTGTTTGAQVTQAAVAMVASSTMTVAVSRTVNPTVAFTATSTMVVGGVRERVGAVAMVATATMSVTAVRSKVSAVAMTATATLTVGVVRAALGSVPMVAVSTLSVTGVAAPPQTGIPNAAHTGFLWVKDVDNSWYRMVWPGP